MNLELQLKEARAKADATPGKKDDKGKKAQKMRARISFPILQAIDNWRVRTIVAH